jgi:CCR4-NOT transcription complex subunit 1
MLVTSFYKILIDLCIARSNAGDYTSIDCFTKLAHFVVVLSKPAAVKHLQDLLLAVKAALCAAASAPNFNQRPYFRILFNILTDSAQPTDIFPEHAVIMESLLPFADTLHELNPCKVPGFAFAWLELASHRFFLPKMLRTGPVTVERSATLPWHKMRVLMVDLCRFLRLHFRTTPLTEGLREYYKGVLRLFTVLLKDFPEFLSDYYTDYCDLLPGNCVQLRNIVLSAYPRHISQPDPFTRNLKVDLLPDISHPPNLLTNSKAKLSHFGIQSDLDLYFSTHSLSHIKEICKKMRLPSLDAIYPDSAEQANIPVINAVVLYIAQISVENEPSESSELFLALLQTLEGEARRQMLHAIANQLRFPNNHTHFFSCILLHLFVEVKRLSIQEEIANVLAERLLAHPPHPWGLQITVIELVKNPKYDFVKKPFVRGNAEYEAMLERINKAWDQSSSR